MRIRGLASKVSKAAALLKEKLKVPFVAGLCEKRSTIVASKLAPGTAQWSLGPTLFVFDTRVQSLMHRLCTTRGRLGLALYPLVN